MTRRAIAGVWADGEGAWVKAAGMHYYYPEHGATMIVLFNRAVDQKDGEWVTWRSTGSPPCSAVAEGARCGPADPRGEGRPTVFMTMHTGAENIVAAWPHLRTCRLFMPGLPRFRDISDRASRMYWIVIQWE